MKVSIEIEIPDGPDCDDCPFYRLVGVDRDYCEHVRQVWPAFPRTRHPSCPALKQEAKK